MVAAVSDRWTPGANGRGGAMGRGPVLAVGSRRESSGGWRPSIITSSVPLDSRRPAARAWMGSALEPLELVVQALTDSCGPASRADGERIYSVTDLGREWARQEALDEDGDERDTANERLRTLDAVTRSGLGRESSWSCTSWWSANGVRTTASAGRRCLDPRPRRRRRSAPGRHRSGDAAGHRHRDDTAPPAAVIPNR